MQELILRDREDARVPVGRIEWAGTAHFLYGVDSVGQVFRLESRAAVRSVRRAGWWNRAR